MHNPTISGLRYSRDNWFACVDIAVLLDEVLSPTAKAVYAILCQLAGFGYRTCDSDDQEVAYLSNISEAKLLKTYKELEAREVIVRNRKEHSIRLIGHNAPCYNEEA